MRSLLALCLFAFFGAAVASAQSVHWETSDSGDPSELQLIFQDCAPEGDVPLPRVDGLNFAQLGTSSQTSIVNFNVSRSYIVTYNVRSTKGGTISIPAFSVKTNKGDLRVAAFSGGMARAAADFNVSSRLIPSQPSPWVGEVFALTYTLDTPRRNFAQLGNAPEWNSSPLVVEDWPKGPEATEAVVNGEARLDFVYRTRGYAKAPGPLQINPASQLVNLQTGSVGFGLFQAPRIEQVSVQSRRPEITVRPLPPAPGGFAGAVGQFKLTSKVVPQTAAPGDPITWTLELTGTGNWPDIAGLPQREVSKDFQVVQPQARRVPAEGKLFDVTLTEDVVLIPTKAGDYTLGPVTFTYFDPKSGSYKTLTTDQTTVTITAPATVTLPGAAATKSPDDGNAAKATAPTASPAPSAKPLVAPGLPNGLPRDPLSGEEHSYRPLTHREWAAWCAVPFLALLLGWLALAWARARRMDPLRSQREARRRIFATLDRMPGADETQRRELLLAWQHDTAALWKISHAAPPSSALPDETWRTLWIEADRALYADAKPLPADWTARAQAAASAKPVPGFMPGRLFLPQNLLPFFFLVAVGVISLTTAKAEDAAPAYRRGDFAAAEKTWRSALEKTPGNPVLRYNLSLALAQQDRWGEAAAYASGAFLQSPGNNAFRWQLALAAEKAGFAPGSLTAFFPAGPTQSLAMHASPGAWQRLLVLACVGLAIALGLALWSAYHGGSRGRRVTGMTIFVLSALLGGAALLSVHTYGRAADQRAVMVWREGVLRSIPTEADLSQKTTSLAPGNIAFVDKTFLGWVRLSFANGQTGWVRKEEAIPLW